ncbi:MAG: SufS family cysteine desulfurase [Tissierellia bacterium]|nr:SufS family cysteine desulfurase [Tissierellia bacterium]
MGNNLLDVKEVRSHFPYLELATEKKPMVYLDSGATTQKPVEVIDAVNEYLRYENGNPHRGAHYLAGKATEIFEGARTTVADFIGAKSPDEIVFLRNATEALNLIAYAYAREQLQEGDEILISILEHHANFVPWQQVVEKLGVKLNILYVDGDKQFSMEELEEKLSERTKIFSITQSSNVTGTTPPVKEMIQRVRERAPEAITIVDGAQSVPHMKVDVSDLDCDFFVFSGHKMYAAMSSGVLYGKREVLEKTRPFLFGGDMIEYVYEDHSTFLPPPGRFEAGTPDVLGAKSLVAAIDFVNGYGLEKIQAHERALLDYAYGEMAKMEDINILTTPSQHRGGVLTFNFKEVHPHDVASILDSKGVAIRSGHHCAQPFHRSLGLHFSCRASFGIYNTMEEVDYFLESLNEVRRLMGIGTR